MQLTMIVENDPMRNGEFAAATRDGDTPRALSPAARRALAEAEERRRRPQPSSPPERDGRGGPDPTRYGDWEVKGLASDF
jgi:hypothetical protein